jgi:hypothetical protein
MACTRCRTCGLTFDRACEPSDFLEQPGLGNLVDSVARFWWWTRMATRPLEAITPYPTCWRVQSWGTLSRSRRSGPGPL